VRLDFHQLVPRARGLAETWQANDVVIEHAGTGISLAQQLRTENRTRRCAFLSWKVRDDKETRVAAQTARLATGQYRIPAHAAWRDSLRQELLAFPNGRFDDQVDSLIQFLEYSSSRRAQGHLNRHPVTGRPLGCARPPAAGWLDRRAAAPSNASVFGPAAARMTPTMPPIDGQADDRWSSMPSAIVRGDVVLDVFAGAGTIPLAAERTRRRPGCSNATPHAARVNVITQSGQRFILPVILGSHGFAIGVSCRGRTALGSVRGRLLSGSIIVCAVSNHGININRAACTQSVKGSTVSNKRPNASKDGVARRLIDTCSQSPFGDCR
jgi:predicted phage terminase large subunit-like protein